MKTFMLLCGILALHVGVNGYVIVAPRVLFVGESTTAFATSISDISTAVLSVKLFKDTDFTQTPLYGPISFSKNTKNLSAHLVIPSDIDQTNSVVTFKFDGSIDGKRIDQNVSVTLRSVQGSLRIITDKPIYKPGQTVNARVLGLDSELKALACELEVTVMDPQQNKMARWHLNTSKGFAELQMPISTEPILGDWNMIAKCANIATSLSTNISFQIAEYVLPKFEVKVNAPDTLYKKEADKSGVSGSVVAEYTYGKRVRGKAKVTLLKKDNVWSDTETVLHSIDVDLDGSVKGAPFQFDIDTGASSTSSCGFGGGGFRVMPCYYFPSTPSPLIVRAVVTEQGTGLQQNNSATVTTAEYPVTYAYEFERDTLTPGFDFVAILTATNLDGSPATVIPGTTTAFKPTVKVVENGQNRPSTSSDESSEVFPKVLTGGKGVDCVATSIPGQCKIRIKTTNSTSSLSFMTSPVANSHVSTTIYNRAKSLGGCFLRVSPTWSSTTTMTVVTQASCYNTGDVTFLLVANGKVVSTQTSRDTPSCTKAVPAMCTQSIILDIPKGMGGSDVLLTAYATTSTNELISDSVVVKPVSTSASGLMNSMSMDASVAPSGSFLPGSSINLTIKTDGASKGGTSLVALSAVDKSVLLLKDHVTLSSASILSEQKQVFDVSKTFASYQKCFYGEHLFAFGGLVLVTDHTSPTTQKWECTAQDNWDRGDGEPEIMVEMEAALPRGGEARVSSNSKAAPSATTSQLRTFFPETWIFASVTVKDGVTNILNFTVPDTITSWSLDGFAVSSANGLGLADNVKVTVFKPFFISLVLPYSVVRGEIFELKVAVYNYGESDEFVNVALPPNEDGFAIESEAEHVVLAAAGGPTVVSFVMRTLRVGSVVITASGTASTHRDTVQRMLLVEPEGVRREYVSSAFVDIVNGTTSASALLTTDIPTAQLVPGSASIRVTATADLMGPSINGLERLVRMPTGCGEQNMITFAPIVSVFSYLLNTNQLTPSVEQSAQKFMVTGYQRELTYRWSNGGFSAFGESDDSASTWLTAFVLRSFSLADDYVYVDPAVLQKSIAFLFSQQNRDTGEFNSVGKVIHKDMMGGIQGSVTLTAYVTAALVEARSVIQATGNWDSAWDDRLVKSLSFLGSKEVSGSYRTTLVCYALVRSAKAGLIPWRDTNTIYTTMMQIAVRDGQAMHWGDVQPKKQPNADNAWQRGYATPSTDVEATAYGLLAILCQEDPGKVQTGYAVARWLSTSRNGNGGWSSTQDTIMALEALALYAQLAFGDAGAMTLVLSDANTTSMWGGAEFTLDASNYGVLQSVNTPPMTSAVRALATGSGSSLVTAVVSWHESLDAIPVVPPPIVIVPSCTTVASDSNRISCKICARTHNTSNTGFAVIESTLFSGVTLEDSPEDLLKSNRDSTKLLKRVDILENQLSFYVDELSDTNLCVTYTAVKTAVVAELKPLVVSAYDYYDTSVRSSVMLAANGDLSPSVEDVLALANDNNLAANSTASSTFTTVPTTTLDTKTQESNSDADPGVIAGSVVSAAIIVIVIVAVASKRHGHKQPGTCGDVAVGPAFDSPAAVPQQLFSQVSTQRKTTLL